MTSDTFSIFAILKYYLSYFGKEMEVHKSPTIVTAVVKGFRTPAGHGRDGGRGGRRPKSLEGGNRGEFRVGGSVGLWGFRRGVWLDFSDADRNDDRESITTLVLVALGAVEAVILY
jgi:hypothetical protein